MKAVGQVALRRVLHHTCLAGTVEEWQTFAGGTPEGIRNRWGTTFKDVSWAVGMTYAETGLCLVAPVQAQGRRFLIGAGAPLAIALDAQNLGKGGETIIHNTDYAAAYAVVQTLFNKATGSEFWSGKEISVKKVQEAAREAGKSEKATKIEFVDKASTITSTKVAIDLETGNLLSNGAYGQSVA